MSDDNKKEAKQCFIFISIANIIKRLKIRRKKNKKISNVWSVRGVGESKIKLYVFIRWKEI